jgi:hypothetical protein
MEGVKTTLRLQAANVFDIKLNPVALVREQTISTERPLLLGEVSANFCGLKMSRGQRN